MESINPVITRKDGRSINAHYFSPARLLSGIGRENQSGSLLAIAAQTITTFPIRLCKGTRRALIFAGDDTIMKGQLMNTAVRTKEQFNMEDFGFEVCEASSGRKPYTQGKDYIIKSVNKGADKNYYIPIISLCEETTDFVIGLLGETVDVGINSKGYICIQPGTKRKVSLTKGSSRGNISIGGMRDKIDSIYGEYKRIYVTVHPYGNFNAVIIKPTGEKDEK